MRAVAFLRSEQGQDTVEYALILAFVVLAGAAMYVGMGSSTNTIWSIVNSRLNSANQSS